MQENLKLIIVDILPEVTELDNPEEFMATLAAVGFLTKGERNLIGNKILNMEKFLTMFDMLKPKPDEVFIHLQKIFEKMQLNGLNSSIRLRLRNINREDLLWPEHVPGKPRDVKATDLDKDPVVFAWQPPENDGGAPILKYMFERHDRFGNWVPAGEVPGTQRTGTAAGLTAGETYQFRVKAVNKKGPGQPSKETGPIAAKPGKPRDVKATTDWDKGHVVFAWQPPENNGGAPIDKYIIEKHGSFGFWVSAGEVPVTQFTGTLAGLTAGETCQFRVKAVNNAGTGEPSEETEIKLPDRSTGDGDDMSKCQK